jgi:hypothetical protein
LDLERNLEIHMLGQPYQWIAEFRAPDLSLLLGKQTDLGFIVSALADLIRGRNFTQQRASLDT